MKSLVLILMVIKTIVGLSVVTRDNPVVSTPKGQIRGLQAQDGDYDMYLGIPYADVDVANPFGPSTPHPNFEGIFDAYHDGVECIQAYNNPVRGVLQCLQLNVYVPHSASPINTLPVMVYIHGGAFLVGHKAELSPRFLMKHDVIIVSINYRLGLYGFLCSSEPGLKNAGLKDQVLAFNWVKETIAAFGGDANQMTIFGQSAGAMSLDMHLHAGENVAQRAILMSGTAMTTWIIAEENDEMPISLAQELGFTSTDITGAIQYLSTIDPSLAVATASSLQYLADIDNNPLTMPCVEAASDTAILTDYPVNLQPKVKGMDIMVGYATKEVMFMYPNADNVQFYRNYSFEHEQYFEFDETYDVDIIRQFYIGDEQPNENLQDVILDYASDFSFVHSAERSVTKYLDAEANSVYKYVFSYEGDRNFFKIIMNLTAAGASHGDDLGYLFDVDIFEGIPITEADQRVIDAITKLWTDFAKYGNPTPAPTDLIPEWKPVDKEQRPYLNIDNPMTTGNRVFQKRMAFWDLFYKLYGHKVRGYGTDDNNDDGNDDGGNGDGGNGGTSVVPIMLLTIIAIFVNLFK